MKISKTTINMGNKRGVALCLTERRKSSLYMYAGITEHRAMVAEEVYGLEMVPVVEITGMDEYGDAWDEYLAAYTITEGGLHYCGTCWTGEDHDLPNWIPDEAALRAHLDGFAAILKQYV